MDVPLKGKFDPARWEKEVYLAVRAAHLVKHENSAEAPGIFDSETELRHEVMEAVDGLLSGYATEYPTPHPAKLADAVTDLMWTNVQAIRNKQKR